MAISSSATGLRPGVVTSTTRPTTPYTGQIIYETDTGYLRVWDGAAWDYFSPKQDTIPGAWTSFTPTITSITVGNGTNTGAYMLINKTLFIRTKFTLGSTSAVTGIPDLTIPGGYTADTTNQFDVGTTICQDTGAATYASNSYLLNSTTIRAYATNTSGTYGYWANLSSTVPHTWAATDLLCITATVQIT